MKRLIKYFICVFIVLFSYTASQAQSTATTLDIVSWNIEWFGSTSNGPSNKALQEQNVVKILRYLDADIYAMCEIVDTAAFRRVVDSLGRNRYDYIIAPFCSFATSPSDPDWFTQQKTAFIYDKNVVNHLQDGGILRNSTGNAYYNWASGRFPYWMSCTATINGITKKINLFVIHAKALATANDYNRRLNGAKEFKDSLDVVFANSNNIILGDYNDDFCESISYASTGIVASSFNNFLADSANYKVLTLPLCQANDSSTIGYSSVIDNHVVSKKMHQGYVANSIAIRKDVRNIVYNYKSKNTSDHYPVFSQFNLLKMDTNLPLSIHEPIIPGQWIKPLIARVYPNPFTNFITLNTSKNYEKVTLVLTNAMGKIMCKEKTISLSSLIGYKFLLDKNLQQGIYFLHIISAEGIQIEKLIKL